MIFVASSTRPGQKGHTPGKSQLGKPGLESPAGNREASRSTPQQNALENQGSGSVGTQRSDCIVEEALKIIHEANEFKVQQLGIVENPENSWPWSFDFMNKQVESGNLWR